MLERYPKEQRFYALREVMQEIALAGLERGGFFEHAAFYGGTCLRIFYGLPRFSEDLDFSLLRADKNFSLELYFKVLKEEFSAFGFDIEIVARQKIIDSAIVSAFVKKNTSLYDIRVEGQKNLKIKFEVDTDPPGEFSTQEKLLLQPYSFYVKCFSASDLFSGKVHALLFRKWKNRVKGRDWFDFEWYIRQGVVLNLRHLEARMRQNHDWSQEELTLQELKQLYLAKLQTVDWELAKNDVRPFLQTTDTIDIWSTQYFTDLLAFLKAST
ncbi:MAG: hypothetical protein LDLANPLL_00325 [Turneriella sp.]|nr:hypothetical protein [Turneriella sp.]